MFSRIKNRWNGQAGCGDVLRLAFPLIMSTGAHTVQMFIDRVFLMRYDTDMMPAAMQGGVACFTVAALFLGIATYVSTFVAQYTGAGRDNRVGPAVWQGVHFSVVSGFLMLVLMWPASAIFDFIGHDLSVRVHEVVYFKIMCVGSMPMLLASVLSCFFSGRGKTWTVWYVTIVGNVANVILNYCLIFGNLGFPEMGIKGAAIGTVSANLIVLLIYVVMFMLPRFERRYKTRSGWRIESDLFKRLLRFGGPSGIQFLLDMSAFTIFVAFVGRIGKIEQAAATMTFSINMLAFLPMIGMGMAVSIMVGNFLGADKVHLAERSAWSAFYLCFIYMALIAIGYVAVPDVFLWAFESESNTAVFSEIKPYAIKLLMFVAFYCLFDTGIIIFSGALKGAGDTRFVMFMSVGLHWAMMVVPAYFIEKFGWGIFHAWGWLTVFVCLLGVAFFLRFMTGKWKNMRVIEKTGTVVPVQVPDVPTVETDTN